MATKIFTINDTSITAGADATSDLGTSAIRWKDLYLSGSPIFGVLYFGDPTTNGTWRIIPDGNNLSVQRRESGSYVEKTAFEP